MATFLSRTDRSRIARWWWTVDHWTLAAVIGLLAIGVLLSFAASPAVAARYEYEPFHFVYRHLAFLAPSLAVILVLSLLDPKDLLPFALALLIAGWALMGLTLVAGTEIKGATRWLEFGAIKIQASEFIKPGLVVVLAWLLARQGHRNGAGAFVLAICAYGVTTALLMLQPDFGQTLLITVTFGALLFLWGLSWVWIGSLAAALGGGAYLAYHGLAHVRDRVDRFLDPSKGDQFQVDTALAAITNGGPAGVGPGEGKLKYILPDAHTDFVFAVAGEEFGMMAGLLVIALFALVVIRALWRATLERDRFVQLAAAGLGALFGLQAIINIAVNVHLIPAKGMTLPFVSYGGSSMLALAVTVGMFLSLTRRRPSVGPRQ
ncbi:MAG TPA: cell division protein FtsW [Alphaproteobacteria bacterium]|nr:cell division protein FtsW [Alphaproteobacteria bacterium]HAJ48404.1 cell division protein FtsW [Alphaproteobacteria bacterium]